MTVAAIVVAGGSGERFGRAEGKQLALVGGLPVVGHAVSALAASEAVASIVVVCDPSRVEEFRAAVLSGPGGGKVTAVVGGGSTRRRSVAAGLAALRKGDDVVVVHDGARPLVEASTVDAAVGALAADPESDGVIVGHPAFDTVKEVDPDGRVARTPDRARLWIAQTPQVFRAETLRAAHDAAEREGFEGTDDASLLERIGRRVRFIEGPRWNIKVTVPGDLDVVAALLRARTGKVAGDE